MVEAFEAPQRDHYEIVNEHLAGRMIMENTDLDFPRAKDVIIISATNRPSGTVSKISFYELLIHELQVDCNIQLSDVMVSMVINSYADWSFGNGSAKFLTGEL